MPEPGPIAALLEVYRKQEARAADIARLLHDEVGPTLSAIAFHLHALQAPPEAEREIRGYLENALSHVREASLALHTNVVERSGLPMAMERLAGERMAASGIPVLLRMKTVKRYPPSIAFGLYRIVELALDNALRHSRASSVNIRINAGERSLSAEVSDKGAGFDAETTRTNPTGIGLLLMESYAHEHRLKLRIASSPGQGTIVNVKTS